MKKLIIKLIFILIPLLLFVTCRELNNKTLVDANSENQISASEALANNITSFTHPGILNSSGNLWQVSAETNSYRMNAFDEVLNAINTIPYYSQASDYPSIVYVIGNGSTPSEHRFKSDSILAYAYALKWARTGNSNDANKAKKILNNWASKFSQIKVCTESDGPGTGCPGNCDEIENNCPKEETKRLEAAWVAPNFAAAAEIIRHHHHGLQGAGWSANDITAFEGFLKKLKNYVDDIVNGVRSQPSSTWAKNNWGASAAWAQMAVGIFNGKSSWYEDAKDAAEILIDNFATSSGEVYECSRAPYPDCNHPQYSLTALTYAAETVRIQESTYLYHYGLGLEGKLQESWKWLNDAFQSSTSCPSKLSAFTCNPNTKDVYPGAEVIYNYYDQSNDLEDLRELQDPIGIQSNRLFIGFTTYTHYDTN